MVGENTYIGFDCNIGNVEIRREVIICDGVVIMSVSHQHATDNEDQTFRSQTGEFLKIKIGNGAWLGAGSIIMADIGAGAIVGAGSVVTKPVHDKEIVVGVPVRPIKRSSNR